MIQKRNSRRIAQRIIIEGDLLLKSPARFGNGENDPYVDLPIALDDYDRRPVIRGTSLAGALRNALLERLEGYGISISNQSLEVRALFGGRRGEPNDPQSALIVEDSLCSEQLPLLEIRDGVAIDPETGTASDEFKYDLELIPAGSCFELKFELLAASSNSEKLCVGLAVVLGQLAAGEIFLGARKRRGLGECEVHNWKVWLYDLTTRVGLLSSLTHNYPKLREGLASTIAVVLPKTGENIAELLGVPEAKQQMPDRRAYFELEGTFNLQSSILIRSGVDELFGPDVVHLHTAHNGKRKPVISGTSLAGVLRARALKILKTLYSNNPDQAMQWVEDLFGTHPKRQKGELNDESQLWASRIEVFERCIDPIGEDVVQQRVRIDRWTGGALDTGLFAEASQGAGTVKLSVRVRNPQPHEPALLLLLWKDLWTGDLPIGGEPGVGKGLLQGQEGCIRWKQADEAQPQTWNLTANGTLQNASETDIKRFRASQNALLVGRV